MFAVITLLIEVDVLPRAYRAARGRYHSWQTRRAGGDGHAYEPLPDVEAGLEAGEDVDVREERLAVQVGQSLVACTERAGHVHPAPSAALLIGRV